MAARNEPTTVGSEGDIPDIVGVVAKGAERRPCRRIPQANRCISTGGRHPPAVGAQHGPVDWSSCPRNSTSSRPVAMSQMRPILSLPAVTSRLPSGLKATV